MSGRDERPKKKKRRDKESVEERPRFRRATTRRRPERGGEAGGTRPNPFEIVIPPPERGDEEPERTPEDEQRLRDIIEGMRPRNPEEQAEREEMERMREAAITERERMQEVFQGRARTLADEMIVFVRERPEVYSLPMAGRGFVAIAQMLDVDAPQEVFYIAADMAMTTLNHNERGEEGEDVYDRRIRRSEDLFIPPPPAPEVMAEMVARLPEDRDNVVTFVNERPAMYPAPVEPTTILAVIELLGIEGPDFYTRLLLADAMRTLRPQRY